MPDGTEPRQFYSDVFDFAINPYGAVVTFGLTPHRQTPARPVAAEDQVVVRMSLEQAKILSMLLRKNLSTYERTNAIEIAIPYQVYTQLGVSSEDWPNPSGG